MTSTNAGDVGEAWTVWDAEARMARGGDWRGVAYSIAHDILPLIPEGSPDHAYQERARMQIKAADRLCAALSTHNAEGWRPIESAQVNPRLLLMARMAGLSEALAIITSETGIYPTGNQIFGSAVPGVIASKVRVALRDLERTLSALPATPIAAGQEVGE